MHIFTSGTLPILIVEVNAHSQFNYYYFIGVQREIEVIFTMPFIFRLGLFL